MKALSSELRRAEGEGTMLGRNLNTGQ